jgi:hypothetical protein
MRPATRILERVDFSLRGTSVPLVGNRGYGRASAGLTAKRALAIRIRGRNVPVSKNQLSKQVKPARRFWRADFRRGLARLGWAAPVMKRDSTRICYAFTDPCGSITNFLAAPLSKSL